MGWYYPQACMTLRIIWEDFGEKRPDLQQVYTMNVLAQRLSVNINDYTMADTFEAEIDYKNFPFDPRTIRSCGVTIHMQDMKSLVDAAGRDIRIQPLESNIRFIGFTDEESISFDDSKRVVRLEGRDNTGLLLDRPYLKGTFPLDQRVDIVLKNLLTQLKETEQMQLDVRLNPGEVLPVISSYWDGKDNLTGKGNAAQKMNYWDVIQNIVGRAGLIAFIELDKLVVTKPRVLNKSGRAVKFIYGKNLKNLQFKRKLGRMKGINIEVTSLNLSDKNNPVIKVRIPKDATAEWSKETGIPAIEVVVAQADENGQPLPEGQQKAAPYLPFRVSDITNRDQLIRIGQEIYEEVGRQQIEGSLETIDMLTSDVMVKTGKEAQTFDVLEIRNSTPVSIDIDQGDLHGISRIAIADQNGRIISTGIEQRTKYLIDRGYDPKIAAILAEQHGKLSSPLYTRQVRFDMDADNGFSCKIDFVNFIESDKKSFKGGRG